MNLRDTNLQEMLRERKAANDKADVILCGAERAGRNLTESEQNDVDMALARIKDINANISKKDSRNTLRLLMTDGKLIPGNPNGGLALAKPQPKTLSAEYVSDFFASIKSGGRTVGTSLSEGADGIGGFAVPTLSAALYEGSNAAGGYAVPVMVDQQIVPLASAEMAIRKLATVLPTSMHVKIPIKATKGTAAAKAEGTGSGSNVFGGTAPTHGILV